MKRTLFWLAIFAIAMAYLEAAIVVYLRELYYPGNILKLFPPKLFTNFDLTVELGREAATVVMMYSIARLVNVKNATRTFAAFVFLFGVWDLFYYIWLKVLIGWPVAWLEWDILFLIPIVWLGPWICPALISLLFIIWGGWVLLFPQPVRLTRAQVAMFLVGAALVLVSFFQPVIPLLLEKGRSGFLEFTPDGFWYWAFIPGFLLMVLGLGLSILPTILNNSSRKAAKTQR